MRSTFVALLNQGNFNIVWKKKPFHKVLFIAFDNGWQKTFTAIFRRNHIKPNNFFMLSALKGLYISSAFVAKHC